MAKETITLTRREQNRAIALTAVLEGRLTAAQAATLLRISLRHCRRLLAVLRRDGPAALAHGNRGRPAPNRTPDGLRARVVTLAQTTYAGFNHQHLTEMLGDEEGLPLSRPTVRRVLLAAGIPSPRTRRPRRHRRRRERMPQAGLLVQLDGSHHDWLEGRGPRLVLHGAIDDATNEVPAALFRAEEDAAGYLWVLRELARHRGLPVAVYSDRHGIFEANSRQPLTLEDQLRGLRHPRTQVGRTFDELGIRWIPADSPQAKGRIERLWGTFQDRLVSELRRARATSLEEANAVLAAFLPRYNRRFTKPPAHPDPAYRSLPADLALDHICCFKYARTVANDNTVRLEEHLIQLLPGPGRRSYAKARVAVHEHLDGTLSVVYQGQPLAIHLLTPPSQDRLLRVRARKQRPNPPSATRRQDQLRQRPRSKDSKPRPRQPGKPRADHPWNQYALMEKKRKALKEAGVSFSLNR